MTLPGALKREAGFQLRRTSVRIILLLALLVSFTAVALGLTEVSAQREHIEQAVADDYLERQQAVSGYTDWGDIAYYGFHYTFDPPSELAFAALGQRDLLPWQHRLRMLALEGQIYESDVGNPELVSVGNFDYALVVSMLLPLLVIALLHDLQASERSAGRYELLMASTRPGLSLWWVRVLTLGLLLGFCTLLPFWVGAVLSGLAPGKLLVATLVIIGHLVFWVALTGWAAGRRVDAAVIAAGLVGIWLALAVLFPYGGRLLILTKIPMPDGGDIVMLQREVVNSGWDQPKAVTMNAFLESYPEWADYARIDLSFEWKWYYAFQQVGDQAVAAESLAYREGLHARDRAAWRLALVSPPLLTAMTLSRLAATDVQAAMEYQQRAREFHASLRQYFYPLLFKNVTYDSRIVDEIPVYTPAAR